MFKSLKNNPWRWFLLGLTIYFFIFCGICLWKYLTFQYDGLDLAIFNQVFFNSAQGQLFEFSIHPHSYLGDHFGLIIILLLPFYYLYKNPITLLILQTLGIALSAIPLGLIAKNIWQKKHALYFGWLILCLPFVQNANTFEFHLLPLAIPLILFSFYFWQKKKLGYYLIFFLLALLVREDVALVYLGFSLFILFWQKKKKWLWFLLTFLISLGWFIAAFKISGIFSGYGEYKFLAYYAWLGNSPLEMIKTVFLHPWHFFSNFISLSDLKMLLFVFGSLAFLPLFKIRYLLPSIFIWAQLLLIESGTQTTIKTHYLSLIIPWLCLATLYGIKNIYNQKNKYTKSISNNPVLYSLVALSVIFYGMLTLGPLIPFVKDVLNLDQIRLQEIAIKNDFINQVNAEDKVVASFDVLPNLSSRKNVYSWHYIYEGTQQFSDKPFVIDPEINKAILDFHDLILLQIAAKDRQADFKTGITNIKNFLSTKNLAPISFKNNQLYLEKNPQAKPIYYQTETSSDDFFVKNNLSLLEKTTHDNELQIKLQFALNNLASDKYLLLAETWQKNKLLAQEFFPVAFYFFLPDDLTPNTLLLSDYNFVLPKKCSNCEIKIQIIQLDDGAMTVVSINSIDITNTKFTRLGEQITLTL